MNRKKIFSAERRFTSQSSDAAQEPSLKEIYQNTIDIRSDLRAIASVFKNPQKIEKSDISEEKLLIAKEEFEKHQAELEQLRTNLKEISEAIDKTKTEIAVLGSKTRGHGSGIMSVAMELDSITDSTEKAAEEILEMTENIENVANSLKSENTGGHIIQQAEDILQYTNAIFESCNFQDLTGQRISKAIKTLNFVGERIDRMIDIWGTDIEPLPEETPVDIKIDNGIELSGPSAEGNVISQDDIDKMFD